MSFFDFFLQILFLTPFWHFWQNDTRIKNLFLDLKIEPQKGVFTPNPTENLIEIRPQEGVFENCHISTKPSVLQGLLSPYFFHVFQVFGKCYLFHPRGHSGSNIYPCTCWTFRSESWTVQSISPQCLLYTRIGSFNTTACSHSLSGSKSLCSSFLHCFNCIDVFHAITQEI